MKQNLDKEFRDKFIIELKDAVIQLILGLKKEELKATSKSSLMSVIDFLNALLLGCVSMETVGEITESFQLNVSLMCLRSQSLEKRLQGLQIINSLIDMIKRKENIYSIKQYPNFYNPHSTSNRTILPATKWLTSELLINWIDENNVINEFFGVNMHQEILKRANSIFKFLTSKKKLIEKHIDLLWNACTGKQETVMSAVFSIITDLVGESNFERQLLDYLMKKIIDFPLKNYDINLISLLGEIQEICIFREINDYDSYPLHLLWNIIQDNSCVNEEVFFESLKVFKKNISHIKKQSEQFMELCIKNLSSNNSVPQSLKILKKIFSCYSSLSIHTNLQSKESIIRELNEKSDILTLLFCDIAYYHSSTIEKSKKINSKEKILSFHFSGGYFTHLERMNIYLNFLEYFK